MGNDHDTDLGDGEVRAELERKHPDCKIEFDRLNRAWGAVITLSSTSERYIVGPTLPELAIKLEVDGSEAG
jgi:hypothetical protein